MRRDDLYARSLEAPEDFWLSAAGSIDWVEPPTRALDATAPPFYRWFPDATLNTCHNAVDRHVAGRGDQAAIVYDSPVTATTRTITYAELRDEVARFAGALRSLGVDQGDRVVIYMPMIPEAVVAMLACARLGAVHSVVFGGFAPNELALRIDDARPKVVLSASCGIEGSRVIEYKPMLDAALATAAHEPVAVVVLQRPEATAAMGPNDRDWREVASAAEPVGCVPVAATDPLYILYTSGTTGRPKGVVRDNGGHAVALQWSLEHVYGVQPGDVFWAASDIGWVVGHSYIVYAPLLMGCTTVLYEGKPVGTPDAGAFWRVVEQHAVNVLFTAPTAIRAIKKADHGGALRAGRDLSSLRALFLGGERLDPDTFHWASDLLGVRVVDHWWQTETGWPMAANLLGVEPLPAKPGSPAKPVPGYRIEVLGEDGSKLGPGEEGAIVVALPLPPGSLPTLWGDDERYVASYLRRHPGYYLTGDGGYFDEDGYLFVMGRMDDVINVAGHRLSTGAMEGVAAGHPDVAECAVVGVHDDLKGSVPMAFLVLQATGTARQAAVEAEVIALIRAEIGAIATPRRSVTVPRLPKTRSGKILRATIRAICDGGDPDVPSTIEDPGALDDLRVALTGAAAPL